MSRRFRRRARREITNSHYRQIVLWEDIKLLAMVAFGLFSPILLCLAVMALTNALPFTLL
ncbi:hypothetical protein [Larsenimonas salina]|uniref:hypothetical protein n=1 Tax=Larsenimonas salina TaxID=1295565 RepID=UPI00207347DF|nr:hypothetical protein [Larsenimonas salina]MCM5703515.1 hypothetical protein [Larsenimonas salina]